MIHAILAQLSTTVSTPILSVSSDLDSVGLNQVSATILAILASAVLSGLLATVISILFQRKNEISRYKFNLLAELVGTRGLAVSGDANRFCAALSQIPIFFNKDNRYAPLEHALVFLGKPDTLEEAVSAACLDQAFVSRAPLAFFWAVQPYRTEWRYAEASHKVIALDAGHICQNLYLAAGSIGCGTCAVAAYDQGLANALFKLDGQDEFIHYIAPVGKIS